jgi:hypothetical protein
MSIHADRVPRYQELRRISRDVNNALLKKIPKDVMDEAGRKIGILRRGVFVFGGEEEMAILADCSLHDIRRQGRTVIERVQAEAPYPPESDAMRCLTALKDAYFSVFLIEAAEPGVGVQVRDAITDETRFIMDLGLGTTATPGMALTARIFTLDDITMTTGAAIPVGVLPAAERAAWLQEFCEKMSGGPSVPMSREERSELALRLIRSLREVEATASISYLDPATPHRGGGAPAVSKAWQVGRNDPCPCGSGKKFKKCCGASR